MARLCVRVTPNETKSTMRAQPGDVVCVVEDDHKFSFAELNCGHYKIVEVPGVPAADLVHLTEHETDGSEAELIVSRHKVTLDLKTLDLTRPIEAKAGKTARDLLDAVTLDKTSMAVVRRVIR